MLPLSFAAQRLADQRRPKAVRCIGLFDGVSQRPNTVLIPSNAKLSFASSWNPLLPFALPEEGSRSESLASR